MSGLKTHIPFASFAEISSHLEKLGLFRMRPELGKLQQVLRDLPPPTAPKAVIQIAGTNGKGSTATFLASLADAAGLRVGLYTSPHFVSFRERFRLNGLPVLEEQLLPHANAIMAAGGASLTYFEFVTALAYLLFSGDMVDIAILETGLGGRWDAVTALPVDALVFTPISLDHCDILGKTVTAIAADKARAIRPGKPVFSAAQVQDAANALRQEAAACGSVITFASGRECLPSPVADGQVPLGLSGEHQFCNAGLALTVWRHVAKENAWAPSEASDVAGLANAFIPGRMQYVPPAKAHGHPALLLDGAHNVNGMAALGKALALQETAPGAVIFSCLDDKDPVALASHLRVLSTGPVFIPPISNNPRAASPESLARVVGLSATPVQSMKEALEFASRHVAERLSSETAANPARHPVLLCGSLYMLGDFFSLRPDCLTAPEINVL